MLNDRILCSLREKVSAMPLLQRYGTKGPCVGCKGVLIRTIFQPAVGLRFGALWLLEILADFKGWWL